MYINENDWTFFFQIQENALRGSSYVFWGRDTTDGKPIKMDEFYHKWRAVEEIIFCYRELLLDRSDAIPIEIHDIITDRKGSIIVVIPKSPQEQSVDKFEQKPEWSAAQ